MDHRILLSGDSAEHRNRNTFVLYHVNEQASSLSRHIAVTACPACQYLIACPCCSFQEAGKSTLVDLPEYVNRAPSRRPKLFVVKTHRGGRS